MTIDHEPDTDVMTALADLRRCDVSPARARRLRRRCHITLQGAAPPATRSRRPMDTATLRRAAVPVLAAAWCVAYVAAIIRYTVAVHASFGAQ